MQSSDTTRRPGSRRKPELNINTSAAAPKTSRDREAIPQTPPGRLPPTSSKAKAAASAFAPGGRALRAPTSTRDADMETFLESLTPVRTPVLDVSGKDAARPEQPRPNNHRDSHDLSLPPRQVTRDSLVANMLLSLDQFSMGQTSGGPFGAPRPDFDDPAIYPPAFGNDDGRTISFNSRSGRPNNGHTYSYSSDLEGADDASRISSRGRRSNSSSAFQSSLGRINSVRETTSHQRGMPETPKQLHSRGGKGSKSSSTNSIDAGYVQVLSSQRWARGFGGRSSSFDAEESRTESRPVPAPPSQAQAQGQPRSPWHIEFSNSFFNNDGYDAAPTPNIPAGPRRLATVPSLPVLPPPEPKIDTKSSVLDRRRSTRSSRSATVGRKAESKFSSGRDVPPVPQLDLESAPAPHVGYEKSKEAATPTSGTTQQKEKPGFFRRMFGSSKTNQSSVSSSAQASSSSVDMSGPRSHQFASQAKSSAPPSRESHTSATHTLQKKTSSFFRRRKVSITDSEQPPIPAVPALPTAKLPLDRVAALSAKSEPSPITSLRRAMDPFLQEGSATADALTPTDGPLPSLEAFPSAGSPEATRSLEDDSAEVERRRNVRGFSPDYEPSPRAVIRSVDTNWVDDPDATGPPQIRTPTGHSPGHPANSPPKSFLQDNSDSEDSPPRPQKPAPLARNDRSLKPGADLDKRTRSPSPTVFKAKSVPNLGRSREEQRLPLRADPKSYPAPHHASNRNANNLGLPIEGIMSDGSHADSTETMFKHAPSLPSLRIDSAEPSPSGFGTNESINQSSKSFDEPDFVVGDPTEDDRQKAQKMFEGSEEFIQKEKAAAWMGEEGIVRQRTLRAYMNLFDFEGQSIVASLRQVCHRLLLRAETQQVDRILVAFTRRWCECNPNHGFRAEDIIHTICYSIILLNTDLHMADIEHKMTRSQFIKNTMTTIRHSLQEVSPGAFDRPSILPGRGSSLAVDGDPRTSGDHDRHNSFRSSFKPPPRPGSALGTTLDQISGDGCGPLVKAPFEGSLRGWESQVEIVLKDIYASIRDDRLPLFGAEAAPHLPTPGGLTVMGMLKRSPSVLSKAPSESVASIRGRIPETAKANAPRWGSKSRSRPRGPPNGFSSSRTSFDDNNSIWSPTESSATWSKASLGRTHTSMSMDSFGSSYPRGEFQQSIGFANALSQAIIREDNTFDANAPSTKGEDLKPEQLLDDESLELAGPPWVKEGIATHKHHLHGADRKAKDRTWTEVFAVVQKGQLSMFSFSPNKSMRSKGRMRGLPKGAVVGGGNWQENATNLGTFSLQQTLASFLPPPGYSRARPNVWALSLPSGAVHLFQVGTPEIAKEFVATANYWSARLSTHPLVGGISNVEYGWSDAIINNALVTAINENGSVNAVGRPSTAVGSIKGHSRPGSGANSTALAAAVSRSSMQSRSSMRSSSFDFGRPGSGSSGVLGGIGSGSLPRHGKLPGDRVHIAEWTPPTLSTRASSVSEHDQLGSLQSYARSLEAELQTHNSLRSPMLLAFTARGSNAAKAMANWERRSEYLLREIVKYTTYVDSLQAAEVRKAEIYLEREHETPRGAASGEDDMGSEVPTPKKAVDVRQEENGRGNTDEENDDAVTLEAAAA
ncbi:hypothetical protein B0T24DRAFT_526830 [Lasiosphaeria ovina]|uniref:SEC7 domain-containing protein n=1 Tax=Lasiosphaeria ovina TaxID=92902 RepID=A0AAE0KHG1_9PEZI|nr:hypothetical protein B0T24DRAFT_526830 [Lasiosphaeria ovina]